MPATVKTPPTMAHKPVRKLEYVLRDSLTLTMIGESS